MGETPRLGKLLEQFQQLSEEAEFKKMRTTNSDHLEWYCQDARRLAFEEAGKMVQAVLADPSPDPSYRDQVTRKFKVDAAEIIEIQP